MANLANFEQYAKQYGGVVAAWINQGDIIKETESEGVCNAIVKEWLASYRGFQSDRSAFVKKFTRRDQSGTFAAAYVPDDYLKKQKLLNRETAECKAEIERREKAAKDLIKKKRAAEALAVAKDAKQYVRKTMGGEDCIDLIVRHSFKKVIDELNRLALKGPCYIVLSLNAPKRWTLWGRKSFGHMVGVELRTDIPLYGFIDPNTGLFGFPKLPDMIEFLTDIVWRGIYQSKNITTFALYLSDAGLSAMELQHAVFQMQKEEGDRLMKELEDLDSPPEIGTTDDRKSNVDEKQPEPDDAVT